MKVAVIETSKFILSNYHEVIQPHFKDVIQGATSFRMIYAYPASKYIDGYPFDFVFESMSGYEQWLLNGVNKSIIKVEYNWQDMTASIIIADTNFPGPHLFQCTTTWTEADCQAAIEAKFVR